MQDAPPPAGNGVITVHGSRSFACLTELQAGTPPQSQHWRVRTEDMDEKNRVAGNGGVHLPDNDLQRGIPQQKRESMLCIWMALEDVRRSRCQSESEAVLQEIIGQASVIAWNDSPRNSNELIAHQLNRMTDELGYVVYTDDKKG